MNVDNQYFPRKEINLNKPDRFPLPQKDDVKQKIDETDRGDEGVYLPIKVMHWNILAQRLCKMFKDQPIDDSHLQWSHRVKLIKNHIKEINPDVLGIAELDCLVNEIPSDWTQGDFYKDAGEAEHKELIKFLTCDLGYDYHFVEKANGLSACAVFFKKDKFKLLNRDHVEIGWNVGDRSMVYCHLQECNSGLEFIFSETHLKAMPGKKNEDARLGEVQIIKKFFKDKYRDIPVFVCGDFNDKPFSSPINSMEEDFVDLFQLIKTDDNLKKPKDFHQNFSLIYGYGAEVEKKESEQLDLKSLLVPSDQKAQKKNMKLGFECVDYVYFCKNDAFDHKNPVIESYLDEPKKNPLQYSDEPEQLLMPNETWPSDHFSLVYTVKLACPPNTRLLESNGQKIVLNPKLSSEFADEEVELFLKLKQLKSEQNTMDNQLQKKTKDQTNRQQAVQVNVFENIDNNDNVKAERQKELRQQKKRLQVLIQASTAKLTKNNKTEEQIQAYVRSRVQTKNLTEVKKEYLEAQKETRQEISKNNIKKNQIQIQNQKVQKIIAEQKSYINHLMKGDNNQLLKTKHETAKRIILQAQNQVSTSNIVDGIMNERMNQYYYQRNTLKQLNEDAACSDIIGILKDDYVNIVKDIDNQEQQVWKTKESAINQQVQNIESVQQFMKDNCSHGLSLDISISGDGQSQVMNEKDVNAVLFKSKLVMEHQASLNKELISEDQIEVDKFGQKVIKLPDPYFSRELSIKDRALMQQVIDKLNNWIKNEFKVLEPLQKKQQQHKEQVEQMESIVQQQKACINTQIFQLRLIQNTLEKMQIGGARSRENDTSLISSDAGGSLMSKQFGEVNSVASTVVPKRIHDMSKNKKKLSPEQFQQEFSKYEFYLDAFKEQIGNEFDPECIKKLQDQKLYLAHAKNMEMKQIYEIDLQMMEDKLKKNLLRKQCFWMWVLLVCTFLMFNSIFGINYNEVYSALGF